MNRNSVNYVDWLCVLIYFALVGIGWLCIFATTHDPEAVKTFQPTDFYTKQLIYIGLGLLLIIIILSVEPKFFQQFSSIFYAVSIISLLGLFFFGKEINGAKAWYSFGSFSIQPAEFAKVATALVVAKEMSRLQIDLKNIRHLLKILFLIALPCGLIIIQPDPGSMLVYGSFLIVLNREGLNPIILFLLVLAGILFVITLKFGLLLTIIGIILLLTGYGYLTNERTGRIPKQEILILFLFSIAVSLSTSVIYHKVFKPHHQERFSVWLDLDTEINRNQASREKSIYNSLQAQSAISDGGFWGKGFLEGTRTRGRYIPEQHTDYIFTVLGEEWGFFGTMVVTLLFTTLLLRLWFLAERQRTKFARIYGYSVTSIFFVHFLVNIGMVIGLLPTIGIPLPFFSYGGSSLWGFTILLFIFLVLDADRINQRNE